MRNYNPVASFRCQRLLASSCGQAAARCYILRLEYSIVVQQQERQQIDSRHALVRKKQSERKIIKHE
jgi:hypothetical protein